MTIVCYMHNFFFESEVDKFSRLLDVVRGFYCDVYNNLLAHRTNICTIEACLCQREMKMLNIMLHANTIYIAFTFEFSFNNFHRNSSWKKKNKFILFL